MYSRAFRLTLQTYLQVQVSWSFRSGSELHQGLGVTRNKAVSSLSGSIHFPNHAIIKQFRNSNFPKLQLITQPQIQFLKFNCFPLLSVVWSIEIFRWENTIGWFSNRIWMLKFSGSSLHDSVDTAKSFLFFSSPSECPPHLECPFCCADPRVIGYIWPIVSFIILMLFLFLWAPLFCMMSSWSRRARDETSSQLPCYFGSNCHIIYSHLTLNHTWLLSPHIMFYLFEWTIFRFYCLLHL